MLVLFTALIAPYFVDWSSYKKDFERETSRIIGQSVEVLGETKVRLLPLPSVTFGGLAIGKNVDGSPMMTVDQFLLDIELMPLLKGEITIVKLNLLRPRVNLHVDESGAIAWTDRNQFDVDPELIKLENFVVSNGEIKVHGLAGGRTLAMEQLNGRISANSLFGPWRIDAEGYIGKKQAKLNVATGRLQDDGSIRLKIVAQRLDLPYRLALDGPVKVHEGLLRWDGDYKLNALDNNSVVSKNALPILSEGKFGATPRLVEIPEFRLEIGAREDPYILTGSGSARIEDKVRFHIEADGRQIDLDRVGQNFEEGEKSRGLSLEARLNVLRNILEKIPVPSGEGDIDLTLPAVVAGKTLIREVSTVFSPLGEGWEIKRFNAVFPGNTKLEAKGKIGLKNTYGFTGTMLVASRQPTGLAAWLGKRNNPYIRRLRTAGFNADVVISQTQTSLENLELVLDDAVLKGKLQRLAGVEGRAAIIARLEGNQINLDDLRAIYTLMEQEDAGAITNHDLDIAINAGKLTGFDLSADEVETRFRVSAGSVSIEKLNASNFFGATLTSSGRIDDLLKQPNGDFKLNIQAKDANPLLSFLRSRIPNNGFLTSLIDATEKNDRINLQLSLNARSVKDDKGSVSKGQSVIKGHIGGTDLEIVTDFSGLPTEFENAALDISATMKNTAPNKLMNQLGLRLFPTSSSEELKAMLNLNGKLSAGFEGFLNAELGANNIRASGSIFTNGEGKEFADLEIKLGSRNTQPLLELAGIAHIFGRSDAQLVASSFTSRVKIDKNKLTLSNGHGQIDNHAFSTAFVFEKNATSNHRIVGSLDISRFDLPIIGQFAYNLEKSKKLALTKLWRNSSFGPVIGKGLDGRFDLKIAHSNIGIGEFAKNLTGQLVIVDGALNLNEIKGNWLGGQFKTDVSLSNAGGEGVFSAQYQFENIGINNIANTFATPDFMNGQLNIIGNLEASGRSPEALVSALTGSGTVALKKIRLKGLNTSPLEHVFTSVDKKGFEIKDKTVLQILDTVIDQGEVAVEHVSVPFIISTGKVRARNINIEAVSSKMTGATEIDLNNGNVEAQLMIPFDPGDEWVEGAVPQVVMAWQGPISNPVKSIDVQPLSEFLSLRNFEREQRRVDLLQATILEKQRLRRDIIITNARVKYRQRLAAEELQRQRQAFLRRDEIRLRKLGAKRHAQLLIKERLAKKEARRKIEEAERKRKAEAARLAAEKKRKAEAARVAEEEKKRQAEAARLAAEAEKKRSAERTRLAAESEKRRKAEAARLAAVQEKKKQELARKAALEKQKQNELKALKAERIRKENVARQQEIDAQITVVNPPKKPRQKPARKPRKLNDRNFADRLNDFLDSR